MMFELVEEKRKNTYHNLIKFQKLISNTIPMVGTNYWSRLFPMDSNYLRKHSTDWQIDKILKEISDEFDIDLSELSLDQGRLYLSHFLLIFREIDLLEMISYKNNLLN